jgi:hypothetical protein
MPIQKPSLAEGEHYIGGIISADGTITHVILLPGEINANWQKAGEWAASIGGNLPTRVEQAMLFATARNAFKTAPYWSCESCYSESGWAWYQYFNYGTQNSDLKGNELSARAVRRLVIQ